jgi:hypothetical protein
MRTLHKTLLALALAAVVALGVIWGSTPAATQQAVSDAVNIQKPGHGALAIETNIQKPGH